MAFEKREKSKTIIRLVSYTKKRATIDIVALYVNLRIIIFQNNVRTAMGVGQASGIVLALASRAGCVVAQYTPSQVKNTIVGWGSATKDQIGHMVQQRLNLASIPQPADAADAAAIALCHCAIAPFVASRDAAIARSAR